MCKKQVNAAGDLPSVHKAVSEKHTEIGIAG